MGKSMVRRGRRRGVRPSARLVGRFRGGVVRTARAKARLDLVDWHHAQGGTVSRTARHFGYSRPTVYRWLGRFDRCRLETLEDRSCRPFRRRRPTWTVAQVEAVRDLRERYPRWGKDKLVVLLRRVGVRLSCSMVGRILARLRRNGALRKPAGRRISVRRRRWARPYAVRRPADHAIARPGDLVELDTLDVRPPGVTHALKQFTARDVISRWDVVELRRNALARTAASVLDALAERMPFPVRAISVDNGSEFMADFEAACVERGIRLYVRPPRSPKAERLGRAGQPHPQSRSSTRSPTPSPTCPP